MGLLHKESQMWMRENQEHDKQFSIILEKTSESWRSNKQCDYFMSN